MTAGDPGDPILIELSAAIEKARVQFGGVDREWRPAHWLNDLSSMVRRTDDWKWLTDHIGAQLQQVETWRSQLQDLLTQAAAIVEKREQRERYTERWWRRTRKLVDEAFERGKEQGIAELQAVYAEALNAWALDICSEIVSETYPLEPTDAILETLRSGTAAITSQKYAEALPLLFQLIGAENALDAALRSNMAVFAGRIYLRHDKKDWALETFQRAQQLAPDAGKPYAALADYYRLSGDLAMAEQFCRQALERSPQKPDGYVEMGLLEEAKKDWDGADEYYAQAIGTVSDQAHPIGALSKMLAPLTGNFYLQLARTLRTERAAEALEAVNRAIAAGVKLEGDYPERIAYRIQAEILETLGRKAEAAQAFFEAGSRFVYRRENQVATELLERARQLNPEHPLADWYLADALYVTSWLPEYPYVREAPLKRAIQVWEERISRELPSAEYTWVYLTRAGLCEQEARLPDTHRDELWWQAAAYLERSALLSPTADAYTVLGRMHRNLNNEATALEATQKAVKLDPKSLSALEERAAILANTGQFAEAEADIEQRRQAAPSEWADAVKAYVLMRQEKFEDALSLINSVIEKAPTEPWYRDLRASCFSMLHKREEAREDYKWIWSRYDPKDATSASYFGTAAYEVGNLDAALEIFEKLLKDPSQDAVSLYHSLAEAYFAKGDFPRAEAALTKCIASTINQRQLNDLTRMAVVSLREDSKDWPHGARVREVLAGFEVRIEERKQVVGQPRSAVEEMKAALREASPALNVTSWKQIAASAALGRLYKEQGRRADALAMYEWLETDTVRFPEARLAAQELRSQATPVGSPGDSEAAH